MILLITLLLFNSSKSLSQAPNTVWANTYGGANADWGYCVKQTRGDNGFIVAGYTLSFGAGNADVYLLKTDENGTVLWEKTIGGRGGDGARSIQQTDDNGFIIVGSTKSSGAGSDDVYLIKTDVNGNTLWTKTWGGSHYDWGFSVQETSDKGYIISGETRSFGERNGDIYLIKTDIDGNTIWTKTIGGPNWDHGRSVRQTSDGGYIITGVTTSFGFGDRDVYLVKTDTNGDVQWTKTFGGPKEDSSYRIQITDDGGYIITGLTQSFGVGASDVYLIKTDSNGYTEWEKTYGGTNHEEGFSVQQTNDGGYIVSGSTFSFGAGDVDAYVIKTDDHGNLSWQQTFGGSSYDGSRSIIQTSDGGYILTGYAHLAGSSEDLYLIRLAPELKEVGIDIKPGSCPNPLNVKSKGVLQVAVLGSNNINVKEIDFSTIELEGVARIRNSIEDVSTPAASPEDCNSDGPDGFVDLCLKFDTQEIVNAIGQVEDGQKVSLTLTGNLNDGTPIEGKDFVRIIAKGKKRPKLVGHEVSSESLPEHFALFQNYPNPFNPETQISYQIPEDNFVSLKIFNSLGQEIRTLVNENQQTGNFSVLWNGRDDFGELVGSGFYFYVLKAGEFRGTKKALLLR